MLFFGCVGFICTESQCLDYTVLAHISDRAKLRFCANCGLSRASGRKRKLGLSTVFKADGVRMYLSIEGVEC